MVPNVLRNFMIMRSLVFTIVGDTPKLTFSTLSERLNGIDGLQVIVLTQAYRLMGGGVVLPVYDHEIFTRFQAPWGKLHAKFAKTLK